jgi:hypothetical protein
MRTTDPRPLGYAFALSRLIARSTGRRPGRAEFSAAEAYGLGLLVYAMTFVFVARALLSFVRPAAIYLIALVILPFAIWIASLLVYYINSLVIAWFRRRGWYSAVTNNPFQHVVIMSLISLIALHFVLEGPVWVISLGVFWLGLVSLNLLSTFVEKFLHEA